MHITEIFNYRDGGTVGFNVIMNVSESEKLQKVEPTITIDCGTNGDGQWYNGFKNHGGTIIEDIEIKQSLIKALEEKISWDTLLLENIKQFI